MMIWPLRSAETFNLAFIDARDECRKRMGASGGMISSTKLSPDAVVPMQR